MWRPTIAGVAGMIVVGSSVGVSRTLTEAPLFTAQALRYAAAAVLLIVLARWTGIRVPRPRGREWLWLCGVAATGLVLFNVAVVRGVSHAEPAVIAVAVACAPVLIGVFGPLLEGGRPTRRLVVAAVVVTAGGVLVVGAGRTDLVGLGWAVVALLCEAGFTLLAVPVLRRLGPWGVSIHAVWIAAVALAVVGAVVEGPAAASRITSANWAAIGYLAVMVTAVAFVLWYSAVGGAGVRQGGTADRGGAGGRRGQWRAAGRRSARRARLVRDVRGVLWACARPAGRAGTCRRASRGVPAKPHRPPIAVRTGTVRRPGGHDGRVITTRRIRLFLIALLTTSGVLHFLRPAPFVSIVPRRLPHKAGLVAVSGAAELGCAAMLAHPASRRLGGPASALLVRRRLSRECLDGAAGRVATVVVPGGALGAIATAGPAGGLVVAGGPGRVELTPGHRGRLPAVRSTGNSSAARLCE